MSVSAPAPLQSLPTHSVAGGSVLCPRCQAPFEQRAEACPSCQFSLAAARQAFPFAAPPLDFLVDPTNVLPEGAELELFEVYEALRATFPQLRISLALLNLAPGTSLREFSFWWFNDAPGGNEERQWSLLLLADAQSRSLCLTPGYALEPWLQTANWEAAPQQSGGHRKFSRLDQRHEDLPQNRSGPPRSGLAKRPTGTNGRPMIPLFFSLALLNVGDITGTEEAVAPPILPEAPAGNVLDRMEWLTDERRINLETELLRIRDEHGVDLFVVVWDRRLPDGESPADLAKHLGEAWHSGEIWGTVLLTPAAISKPTAVTGGTELSSKELKHLAAAATYSVEFGAKGWTDEDRLEQTALVLAEELVFARQTMGPRPKRSTEAPVALLPATTSSSFLSPPILAAAGALLVFVVLLLWYALRRRGATADQTPSSAPEPAIRTFPAPTAPPRLGAPWSGGASLIVPLYTPSPD